MSDSSPSSPSQSPSCLINADQREILEHHYPCAGYWFNMLPTHPFIHGPPSQPSQTQFQGPVSMPPPYSLQGMLHNPDGVVHPDPATALSTQQPHHHGANTVISVANIDISVPLNTGVVGERISHVQIHLPVDIPFEDFFSRICAKMDLDPANAELGYKFHNDREPTHQAASTTRARRDEAVNDSQDPLTSISFASELQELNNKLDSNTSSASAAPALPVIHIHIPPVTKEALGDTGGHRRVNTSRGFATTLLCHDKDDEFITYPPITDVLREMDATMPLLHMSQYEDSLLSHGVAYVNGVVGLSDEFFVDVVGMPMGEGQRKGHQ
ncbi:uncharacterized protein F5891DRAFT_1183466 [Suillus fuscotomentosus]|uniref:Uncharacterized protein n=1 Tax=Suillus fuscotomentosus TaxID=1912939 RepID=A0AAD4EIA6_9AGAM|nr:uncharacterized protein F5891DRAFT_1183466 [Suillus fuscotomentosus]KAG1905524.1 hypothetical protein F5891DRAFT_1183466 [Suillus fuscotomentosus]